MRSSFIGLLMGLFMAGCATSLPPAPTKSEVPASSQPLVTTDDAKREGEAIAEVDLDKSIFFASGEAEVDAKGKVVLRQHADQLKGNPKQRVLLVGYTDDRGSSAFNIAVADMRVNAVHKLLREYGVPQKQLRRYSAGGEKNSNACRSDECRQLMRRVELKYDAK
jgi:outer membrane protein OmpA-like peptidoglycan-associated protein